jgi:hypothetical protein
MKTLTVELILILVVGMFSLAIIFGIYAWVKNDQSILTENDLVETENIVNTSNIINNEDTTIPFAFPISETQQDFTFITDYSSEEFADITDSSSIFTDPMFSDIIKYMSTISDNNEVVESGVEKCLKNCEGNCIEYGFTGVGICFPSSWTPPTTEEFSSYYDMS